LTIGAVRGIRIRVHWTFLLVILWAIYNWGWAAHGGLLGALFGIALIIVIFVFVVVHELAHSLVARRYGVQVREIELSPIGGFAKMESMPAQPQQELVMALAGPLLNLLLSLPLGGAVLWMTKAGYVRSLGHLAYLLGKPSWQGFVLNAFVSNALLAVFNLLPAFPMDGGRILRSALASRMDDRHATGWAAYAGQLAALALGTVGILAGYWILVILGLFVFAAARHEFRLSELHAVLADLTVGQTLITTHPTLSPDETLAAAVQWTMHGHGAPYPVIIEGRLAGLLTQLDITSALEAYGPEVRVGDIMRLEYPTLAPSDTLAAAHRSMATSGLRTLPVTADGQFLGTVTMQQINEIHSLLVAQQRPPRSASPKAG